MKKISLVIILFCVITQSSFAQNKDEFPSIHVDEWRMMNAAKSSTFNWFKDAKFGMFIHWGLYAIPAGVWKGKKIDEMRPPHVAEWIQHAAQIPRMEYAELAKQFNPVKFNADSIVRLAKAAGMKYIVITSKHHDGFAMYHSQVSPFNIVDATPFKRDVLQELYDACKREGIEFGIYYSHNIDWYDGSDSQYAEQKTENDKSGKITDPFGANLWDPSPNSFEEYLTKKAYPQVTELMKKFPGMKCLWYDMYHRMTKEQSFSFYNLATQLQPQIIITERIGNGFGDYDIPGDNKIPIDVNNISKPWETVGTLNNSWGYKSYDNDWKTPKEVLFWLIEIISKGGNYMLNIGPTGEGVVPVQSVNNLKKVGNWLAINGEAIYGTEKWNITREGSTVINFGSTEERAEKGFDAHFTPEDFWFTKKKNALYAISIEKPLGEIIIKSFNSTIGEINNVEILGKGKVKFKQTKDALTVTTPNGFMPANGFVVKVEL